MNKKISKILKEIFVFKKEILKLQKSFLSHQKAFSKTYNRFIKVLENNLSKEDCEVIRYYFDENISNNLKNKEINKNLSKFKDFIYLYHS